MRWHLLTPWHYDIAFSLEVYGFRAYGFTGAMVDAWLGLWRGHDARWELN